MRRLLASLVAVAALLSSPSRVNAAPADPHARAAESFEQARDAFRRGDYAAAAAAFEQAARFEPHPAPLLNAAEAWERAGELVRALTDCDLVLAMGDSAAEHRGVAEGCRARLEPKVSTLDVSGPSTFTMQLDSGSPQILPARVRVPAGRHTLVLQSLTSRTTRTEILDLAAGERRAVVATEPPAAPAAAAPRSPDVERPRRGLPTTFWVASGVTLASGAVAGTFGILTVKAKSDFDDRPSARGADDFERKRLTTNVALGVTAVAGVTAFLLWVASRP